MDYKALYEQQLEENKQLTEKCNCIERQRDSVCEAINKLKQDMILKEGRIDFLENVKVIDNTQLENEKLKEENKKLKEENENWKKIDMDMLESEYMMGKDVEIQKLKKKNEELEDDVRRWTCEVVELREQGDELEEENTSYLDIINELGDYIARIDQNAVDVFNDITKGALMVTSRTLE